MSQHRTIAPRTRRQLEEALKSVIPGVYAHNPDGFNAVIDAIDAGFVVKRRQDLDAIQYADPEVGQVWRNRRSRRLVRIDRIYSGDIYWSSIDGTPGPKAGETWVFSFFKKYEYMPERRGLK